MLCNDGRNIVNLSDKKYRSCHLSKCGGWKFVHSGCSAKKFGCTGTSGAWLPAVSVCNQGLYASFAKSSSSSSPSIYLENLAQFRSSSLDASLIDDFYNKGVNVSEIDLDQLEIASSSTSSGFSLLIYLDHQANQLGEPYSFPEDLNFYVYDEKLDGTENPGMISAQKVAGENRVLVNLSSGVPNGTSEFSFQLNIEHESISTWRRRFVFRNDREYSYETILSEPIANRPNRLSESYISYLANWISQFWVAYDLNDFSLLEDFVRPNPSAEFDPFQHARWTVLDQFTTYAATSVGPAVANTGLVAGWNFLGVSPSTWQCIKDAGLYQHYGITKNSFTDWITGKGKYNDPSFDCRSFTHAAIRFLREQLKDVCPGATVSYLGVLGHAMVLIDLGGDPSPCCEGTIVYEPQNGNTWNGKEEYCKAYPESCVEWESDDTGVGVGVGSDDNPDWEKSPKEVERIKDVICGCLTGNGTYPSNTAEGAIQQKCNDGTFGDWFKDTYSFEPGKNNTGSFGLPQILDCKKCLCLSSPDATTGSPCLEDDQGTFTPYVCSYHCIGKWSCGTTGCFEVFSPGGNLGQYESKEECESDPDCNFGAWCTGEFGCDGKFYISGCGSGSLSDWQVGNEQSKVQGFQKDKECSEISCPVESLPECQCVYEWVAKYDCDTGWKLIGGGQPYGYCGSPLRALDQWVIDDVGETPFSECYRTYTIVSGECTSASSCGDLVFPPPSLPSGTPTCCGAWCSGELACDGKFYVTGCESGSIDEWRSDNAQNKAQNFQEGKTCSDIECVVETVPACGAWCTGEFGCDEKFYVTGCNSGTLYDWEIDNAQNKAQGFQEGKTCSDISCTAETLPTCGAWCAGELGCDGKFYVMGCNSGSLYDWQVDNDQDKAQNFQEGKTCSDISCPVETLPSCQCVYEWVAKYDCDTGWKLLSGGQPYSYCGSPLRTLDQWVIDDVGETPLGSCYRTYTSVSGSCASLGSCEDLVFPPSLPGETPTCCGAWCTGELACDGKFYVTGCNSGTLADWQSDNAQNKAQNFQDGKTCSEISCVVTTVPDCSSSSSCSNPPNCSDKQFVNDLCECECLPALENGCYSPKVQTGAAFGCECVCPSPPNCNDRQFVNDNCECECFSASVNGCESPKVQTGPECDCLCPGSQICGPNQVLNNNCECQCSCPAGECCEEDVSDPSQYVCVPCSSSSSATKCICDPYSGPIPSDEGTEDCSLCQKTWICDSQQGPVENPGFPVWSTTGPTEEQAKETCKETFDCYGGCYGYWTDYYYGQFESLAECESECVERYYCQGWNSNGGSPCYSMGPDTYGEKNCDKCQIIGYQCDSTYGKIPVYGNPSDPLPSGLMSETDTCYETYSCDSYSQCVSQGWATSGDNEAACKLNCSIRAWECNQSIGCQPIYGDSPISLSPGQYSTESDCGMSCLERYDCQPWGCYSVGYNTDPNLPTSCAAMDCVERYECNPSGGCQSVGYGKTGAKSCDEFDCSPRYTCDLSQGCIISGYGPTETGSKSCGDFDCEPRYECNQDSGCKLTGYGPNATGSKECDAESCVKYFVCVEGVGCKEEYAEDSPPPESYPTLEDCRPDCPISGCTNPNSPNYNANATCDDGSCRTCCNQGLCVVDDQDAGNNCNNVGNGCCDNHCFTTAGDCSPSYKGSFTATKCDGTQITYGSCFEC